MDFSKQNKKAVTQLLARRSAILTNPAGTGKTTQILREVIKTLQANNYYCVVICPLNVKREWKGVECYHFEHFVKYKLKSQPDCIIVDESHRIKNYTAKSTQRIIRYIKKTKRVYFSSATPSPHRPKDIYWQLKLVYGDKFPFKTRIDYEAFFCQKQWIRTSFGVLQLKYTDRVLTKNKKLMQTLIDKACVQTISSHPCKIHMKDIKVTVEDSEVNQYWLSKDKFSDYAKTHKIVGESIFDQIKDNTDFSNSIIFVNRIKLADKIASYLNCARFHSKVPKRTIETWLNDGSNKPLVTTYASSGVGLNLNKEGYNKVFLIQLALSSKIEYQAFSRLTRGFAIDNLYAYRYICDNDPVFTTYSLKNEYLNNVVKVGG